ncbi:type IV toxin-antitoxin system AbiEi family antitoxin domain-containing protein [Cryptosporangium phraense]|uniref:type IV toxin-antitoxin system AbiEi family antitoxin domain-containing protein n=1 Tax=Cryptosporangium phraense TaxID=2593070 RepID=UPI001478A5D8|nr:type IV toxin-antitoxin system AbiEi family antitoxin domain-containing protein [Cryptosporangium phraense]
MNLDALLAVQQGVISRRQVLACGLSDEAIRWRLRRGLWRRVLPGLFATFGGPLEHEQRMIVAALVGGDGAQITGVAALRFHRVRYLPDDPRIHVLVPADRVRRSRGFVVVSRTSRPDPHPVLRPALDVCSPARAGADAARTGYPRRAVRAMLADLLQRRRVTIAALDAEYRTGPSRGSRLLREVLDELGAGVRSATEAELRALALASDVLPPIRWNPALRAADGTRLPTPDGWIEDVGLAFELDSAEFHTSLEDYERTRDRHNRLAAHGVLTLHFSPADVRKNPRRVLDVIERAYRRRPPGFSGVRAVDEGLLVP